jgi:hypothetical protein
MATDLYRQIEAEIRAGVAAEREKAAKSARETAEKAVAYAQSIAPVLTDLVRAGHAATPEEFRDSIHSEKAPDVDGMPAYKLVSDVDYARFLEYGTRYMHEFGTFAQTAKHFGGDLRGGGEGSASDENDDDRGDDPTQ